MNASANETGSNADPSAWASSPPRIVNPLMAARHIHHLVPRFIGSLPPTPPSVSDEVWVDDHLLDGERALWIRMSNQDRRHSVAVAQRFVRQRPHANRAEIAGAILHDVGKVPSGLGAFGRAAATLLGRRTARFASYHDHEEIGAEMVAAAGSEPATVQLVAGVGPAYADLHVCDHA